MRILIYISILLFTAQSCSDNDSMDYSSEFKEDKRMQKGEDVPLEKFEIATTSTKTFGKLSFGFSSVSATNYLSRIGKSVKLEDAESLKKESVFMLVIGNKDATKDILESEQLTMDSQDAVQYLIGKVTEDFVVIQKDKRITPEGVQYDGKIGSGEKIRLTFFFKEINLEEPFTIEYYDRLFGKGIIKMKNTNNELISKL